ncbi:hypothetical protein RR46_15090 [Papilio xuthus]|uniref:Uncharacterized protein n=1 Tax=Papilio xuthus TaxID=66420 RepID=A0A194PE19_PAPXU|nr:hypothetical protein RR46_15090 [Papilio xuthus]
MGNVQCCASDRFDENKQPKKPKSQGRNEKPPKNSSDKTNGLSGDKGDRGVHKVVIVAEEASDRPAPAAALAQTPLPAPGTQEAESQAAGTTDEHDGPRNESMAAARERFFGQKEPKKVLEDYVKEEMRKKGVISDMKADGDVCKSSA